jgi:hypothetical protein
MLGIRRREFVALVGGAAAWTRAARAQQAAMPVVGLLRDATERGSEFVVAGLRKGLAEAGFIEGRNYAIDYAWIEGQIDRLPALAAELTRRRVSVMVTRVINATFAAKAAYHKNPDNQRGPRCRWSHRPTNRGLRCSQQSRDRYWPLPTRRSNKEFGVAFVISRVEPG